MKIINRIRKWFAEKEPQTPILDSEISRSGNTLYGEYHILPYNPDRVVQKKGGLEIFDEMMQDDQVQAVTSIKKHAVLGRGWEILSSGADREIADFVDACLGDSFPGVFDDALFGIMTAMDYGFSVTEIVWTLRDDGAIGIKTLKTRTPHCFEFVYDEHGDLLADGILQRAGRKELRMPVEKFIIFSHNKTFDNWYGQSDHSSSYRSWWSKSVIIKFWNIYLERFGMPLTIGWYPKHATPDDREAFKNILDGIQSKTSIRLPEGFKIDFLEAVRGGDAAFAEAIRQHNLMITRAHLVPDLLGFSETSSGSYALGRSHFDVFMWVLERTRRQIEEVINEQLIKRLVNYNFSTDVHPKFKFKPMTEKDRDALLASWLEAVKAGVVTPHPDDEQKIREQHGFTTIGQGDDAQTRKSAGTSSPTTPNAGVIAGSQSRALRAEIKSALTNMRVGLLDYLGRNHLKKDIDFERVPLKYLADLKNALKSFLLDACQHDQDCRADIEQQAYKIAGDQRAEILKLLKQHAPLLARLNGKSLAAGANEILKDYYEEESFETRINDIINQTEELAKDYRRS